MADDQGDAGTGRGLAERARQNAEVNADWTLRDHPSTPPEPRSNPYASTPQDKVTHQRPAPKGEKAMYKKAMDWSSGLKKNAPVYDDGGVVDTDAADGKKPDDARAANAKKVQQAESVIGAAGQTISAPHQYHEGAYGPVYDKGGKVNVNDGKHQVAILKDGERVLTEKQNSEWEKAKNLGGVSGNAPTTLPIGGKTMRDSNDVTPDMTPKKVYDNGGKVEVKKESKMATIYDGLKDKATGAKKTLKSMTHTKTHNGKHVVTHKHHAPHDSTEHDQTHMMNDMDEVHAHMDKHNAEGDGAPDASAPQLTASPAPAPAAPAAAPGGTLPQAGV